MSHSCACDFKDSLKRQFTEQLETKIIRIQEVVRSQCCVNKPHDVVWYSKLLILTPLWEWMWREWTVVRQGVKVHGLIFQN